MLFVYSKLGKLPVLKVRSGFTGNHFKSLKSAEYWRNSCYSKSSPWCKWHKTWGGLETETLLDSEVGKPQTGPISNLFRKKQAIKRMLLIRLRHMFSNKFQSDIECCICFWWRRGRKAMVGKSLGWNWSSVLLCLPTQLRFGKHFSQGVKCTGTGTGPSCAPHLLPELKQIKYKECTETVEMQTACLYYLFIWTRTFHLAVLAMKSVWSFLWYLLASENDVPVNFSCVFLERNNPLSIWISFWTTAAPKQTCLWLVWQSQVGERSIFLPSGKGTEPDTISPLFEMSYSIALMYFWHLQHRDM